jgi:chromosome partitioning protein
LIDLDPQCNATVALGIAKDLVPNTYTCLLGADDLTAAARPTDVNALTLVPSTPDLAGATVELPRLESSEQRLREALASVHSQFDNVILDCPPSLGPLSVNALVAADRVIVPVQAEYLALEGLAQFLDTLALIQRELNPNLKVAGMLITMFDGRTRLALDVERELRDHFPTLVLRTVIPRNVRIHHAPPCAGADAYFELAKEVAERG